MGWLVAAGSTTRTERYLLLDIGAGNLMGLADRNVAWPLMMFLSGVNNAGKFSWRDNPV